MKISIKAEINRSRGHDENTLFSGAFDRGPLLAIVVARQPTSSGSFRAGRLRQTSMLAGI